MCLDIISSINKLGITISAVIIKNKDQLPSNLSTITPLNDDSVVRAKFPSDAINAYWVAVKERLVR